jgi:glycine dehydrogenase
MICDLTGMDVANASLLDEATAAAEAMALAHRSAESTSTKIFAERNLYPQTIAVVKTRADPLGWTIEVGDDPSGDYFCGLFQYPGTFGEIRDFRAAIQALHARGGLAVLACDPLSGSLCGR